MKKSLVLLALVAGLSNAAQGKDGSFLEGRATGLTQAAVATAVGVSVATALLQKEFRNNRRDGLGVTQSLRAAWGSLSKAQKAVLVGTGIVTTGLAVDGGAAAWNQGDTYVVKGARSLYDFIVREDDDQREEVPEDWVAACEANDFSNGAHSAAVTEMTDALKGTGVTKFDDVTPAKVVAALGKTYKMSGMSQECAEAVNEGLPAAAERDDQ